jgi:uncharacterized protein YlxW (UPF0749 family)
MVASIRLGSQRSTQPRSLGWRLATPVAFLGAGALLVTSAVNSAGTDLRPGQYGDLADLAEQETDRVQALQDRVASLNGEIETLSGQLDDAGTAELKKTIDDLAGPAGMTPVEGPGLTVTLQDAPEEIRDSAGAQVSSAIVHQQDIQAVVNAMWSGGAEAMTIQGQRVVSTTGIKCVGNTVLLHGVTYSPPYVISAIGDAGHMRSSLEASPYIQAYLDAVDVWQLGWDVKVEDSIDVPAYSGTENLRYARPAGKAAVDDGT